MTEFLYVRVNRTKKEQSQLVLHIPYLDAINRKAGPSAQKVVVVVVQMLSNPKCCFKLYESLDFPIHRLVVVEQDQELRLTVQSELKVINKIFIFPCTYIIL